MIAYAFGNITDGLADLTVEEVIEGTDYTVVTAAVASDDGIVNHLIGNGDLLGSSLDEVSEGEVGLTHFTAELTLGTHNTDISSAAGESAHGKATGYIVLKLQIYYLVVNDVIVALEYAFTVLGSTESKLHVLVGGLGLLGACLTEPAVLLIVKIKLYCIIGTFLTLGTAVYTTVGSALGSIFGSELGKLTE